MFAAVTPADDGPVDVAEPVSDPPVDDTPVAEGLFPLKPSEGVPLGVPPDDPVTVASVLEGADVALGNGLDTSVNVCVVAYVPPKSSLIVLNAAPPVGSAHCKTVTVNVESSADDTAVPCRRCNAW